MEILKIKLSIDDAKSIFENFSSQISKEDDSKLEKGVEFEHEIEDSILFVLKVSFYTETYIDENPNMSRITKRSVYCDLKAYNTSGSIVEFDVLSDGGVRFDIEEKIKEYFTC